MSETTVNVGKATSGGYRPLSLTLKGFKGIRSGLGRDAITLDLEALVGDAQLVAIAGSNGSNAKLQQQKFLNLKLHPKVHQRLSLPRLPSNACSMALLIGLQLQAL